MCIFQARIHRVAVQIFLRFSGKKAWGGQKETFVKYRDKDSTPEVYGSKKGA
jgi:hypothetical protein